MSKIFNHAIESLNIDHQGLEKIKELSLDRKTRIIFMPVYKSFADPLLLHFINYQADLELGFTFGNYEDSPKIVSVESMLRRIGCFLIKRKEQHNINVNYVNESLLHDVIEQNQFTTIFQNDERPRNGKFSLALFPDYLI